MRRFFLDSLALGLAAAFVAGCGGGGSTTASGAGGASTASTGTSTSKATTGSQVTTSVTGSSSSGMAKCVELMPSQFQRNRWEKFAQFVFAPGVMLGGAAKDNGALQFFDLTLTGKQDLGSATNAAYATCTTCLLVNEDIDPANGPAKVYFQQSGSVDLGTSKLPAITGTITDATLIEVDPMTLMPNAGGCVHIATASFMFDKAPAGWTCDPGFYADKASCECGNCGIPDPDCAVTPALGSHGCGPGQTCNPDGKTCAGTPTGWTCPVAKYNENQGALTGPGTCDCTCGIPDPDCRNAAATVNGCTATGAGSKCNAQAICVPAGWKCDVDYYGDKALPNGGCDCGCGVLDIDCADATKPSCDTCDDPGSCDTHTCMDAMSKINATNNAVCL